LRLKYLPFLFTALVLGIPLLGIGTPAYAVPDPTAHLDQALKAVRWIPEKQGTLLVVDPQHTTLVPTARTAKINDIQHSSVRALAGFYGRKLVSFGSLTLLAPTTMVRIEPPATPPDFTGEMEGSDALRFLLAGLKPDQWQAITSSEGLSIGSLTPAQQVWMHHIAPPSSTLVPINGKDNGKTHQLDRREYAGIRLRLSRDVQLTLNSKDGPSGGGIGFQGASLHSNASMVPLYTLEQNDTDDSHTTFVYRHILPNTAKPCDIDFSSTGANAAMLRRPVSVAVKAPTSLTLGMLIQRAAKVTGWELYTDPRIAKLPIWVRSEPGSETVATGDLLRALCLAVTGTFRRVGPADGPVAFVLTDDREGIGTRIARIVEWESDSSELAQSTEHGANTAIKASKGAQLVTYAPNDPFGLSADLSREVLRRSAAQYGKGPYVDRLQKGDDLSFPVTSLPPAYQRFVEDEAKKAANSSDPQQLQTDRVRLEPSLYLALLLPDGGTVRTSEIQEGESLLTALDPEEPPTAPESPNTATNPEKVSLAAVAKPVLLAVTAETEDEARLAIQSAHTYGFQQVWLQVPQSAIGHNILVAAVTAGQAVTPSIPVWAVVSPLKISSEPTAENVDRNLLGESSSAFAHRRLSTYKGADSSLSVAIRTLLAPPGDFASIDTAAQSTAQINGVTNLATVPGIAGLALTETVPPGYGQFDTLSGPIIGWWSTLRDGGDFGYSAGLRLAFLRKEGYDPIDLSVSGMKYLNNGGAQLPFFPDNGVLNRQQDDTSPLTHWAFFRREYNERFMNQLYAALQKQKPSLPIVVAERSGDAIMGAKFWASWDSTPNLPLDKQDYSQDIPSKAPHPQYKKLYQPVTIPDGTITDSVSIFYSSLVFGMIPGQSSLPKPNAFIVDFRAHRFSKTQEILKMVLKTSSR
jgi:hypothetical protein